MATVVDLSRNPGKVGERAFIDAAGPDGIWRSAAYWARKDRGYRLRAAQEMTGDGEWINGKFIVSDTVGTPWIAALVGKHGNRSTYINWECRCPSCHVNNSHYGSDYRAGIHDDDVD